MKKGTILITTGFLMIASAVGLVGYNLLQSYQAGESASAVLEELQEKVEETTGEDPSADGESAESADTATDQNGAIASAESGAASASAAGNVSSDGNSSGNVPNVSGTTAVDGTTEYTEDILAQYYPEIAMPTASVHEISYLGWVDIPSLGITLPVQSEWQYSLLDISPSRYSGSVYTDDLIIGGHSYITHFRGLRNISAGANVYFTDIDGNTYNYQVAWTESLNPDQGESLVTSESDQWDLTLFTCNTGGGSRCVVRCVRV